MSRKPRNEKEALLRAIALGESVEGIKPNSNEEYWLKKIVENTGGSPTMIDIEYPTEVIEFTFEDFKQGKSGNIYELTLDNTNGFYNNKKLNFNFNVTETQLLLHVYIKGKKLNNTEIFVVNEEEIAPSHIVFCYEDSGEFSYLSINGTDGRIYRPIVSFTSLTNAYNFIILNELSYSYKRVYIHPFYVYQEYGEY